MKRWLPTLLAFLWLVGCGESPQTSWTSETIELPDGRKTSRLNPELFQRLAEPDTAGRQRRTLWCWAASLQMILNFHGLDVEQEQAVRRLYGDLRNRSAFLHEVIDVADGWRLPGEGGNYQVHAEEIDLLQEEIVASLHAERPFFIGMQARFPTGWSGHGYVLTGATWSEVNGRIRIDEVTLADPWPDYPPQRELDFAEVRRTFMGMVAIDVERVEELQP